MVTTTLRKKNKGVVASFAVAAPACVAEDLNIRVGLSHFSDE